VEGLEKKFKFALTRGSRGRKQKNMPSPDTEEKKKHALPRIAKKESSSMTKDFD